MNTVGAEACCVGAHTYIYRHKYIILYYTFTVTIYDVYMVVKNAIVNTTKPTISVHNAFYKISQHGFIYRIFRKWDVGVWIGSRWLRIGTVGWVLVNAVMNLRVQS